MRKNLDGTDDGGPGEDEAGYVRGAGFYGEVR